MQRYIHRKIMGQNTLWRLGIFFLVLGCTASSDTKPLPAAQRQYFKADWAQHKLWDDGLAEVATYQAQ
ncbi:MAG: hypothetical protein JWQ14_3012, partial [Adhaeribacter sp.]|nr:hypothetical protein [Adhaeribacter sp.]